MATTWKANAATRFASWLVHAPATHVAGLAGGLACGMVGTGLYARQNLLQGHQVCLAATEQLRGAESVRRALGGEGARREGPVGGYVDALGGTAVLTLTLRGADGASSGTARVEAETEWVSAGRAEPEPGEAATARWLLRHLEFEPREPARGPAEVLYSVPAKRPPSAWAPSREPSGWLPDAVRPLLPEPQGLIESVEGRRLFGTFAFGVTLHVLAFSIFRGRVRRVQRTGRAMELLALRATPEQLPPAELKALRAEALDSAVAKRASERGLRPSSEAFFGCMRAAGADGQEQQQQQLDLYVAAEGPKPDKAGTQRLDVLIRAVRSGARAKWQLVHVSVHDPQHKEARLSEAAADDAEAARAAFVELVSDAVREQQRIEKQ